MPLSADEPIRSLIAMDMILNGNFLAPKLNGFTYLNKPPLYNWIIVGFYKIFHSYDEWVLRLPSILSLLGFGFVILKVAKSEQQNRVVAVISALAFITSGNILIYSSYLGHIDIMYSLVTFIQIYVLLHFFRKKEWLKAFAITYALTFIGFMMKGLPSIVFQGISIITLLIYYKSFKKFFSVQHILSGFIFLIPLGVYLWLFNQHYDVTVYLQRLLTESSSRTITDKSFLESIGHIFTFPFNYLLDIMPWGIAALIFIRKDARNFVKQHDFLKVSLLLFLTNLVIYWLSPDYRARYVFMLTPFLLIPSIAACVHVLKSSMINKVGSILAWIAVLSVGGMYFYVTYDYGQMELNILLPIILVIIGIVGIILLSKSDIKPWGLYALVFSLLIARIGYSGIMVPFRVATGPYLTEKTQGLEIAKITKNEPLAMYNCNVSLTMNWYVTIAKNQSLETQTKDYSFDSYYLVPTEVIRDTSNIETYYTFVRRYKQKPYQLVKFKHRFPEMPKKKK